MFCKHNLWLTFLNEPKLIFWTQFNDFKCCYLIPVILFDITHSFAYS